MREREKAKTKKVVVKLSDRCRHSFVAHACLYNYSIQLRLVKLTFTCYSAGLLCLIQDKQSHTVVVVNTVVVKQVKYHFATTCTVTLLATIHYHNS